MDYKGFEVVPATEVGFFTIKMPGRGGSVANVLQGLFSKPHLAQNAIDKYLATKKEPVKNDPKVNAG